MRVQTIKFRFDSAGLTNNPTTFQPSAFTLFVGPNNGGKSRALFEISQTILPEGVLESLATSEVQLKPLSVKEANAKRSELEIPKIEGESSSDGYIIFNVDGSRTQVHWPSVQYGLVADATPHSRNEAYKTILGPYVGNLDGVSRPGHSTGKYFTDCTRRRMSRFGTSL